MLFGSAAAGTSVPTSDVDILIVVSDSTERSVDRPGRFIDYFGAIDLDKDLFVYTEQEIASGRIRLADTALETGWVLYEA